MSIAVIVDGKDVSSNLVLTSSTGTLPASFDITFPEPLRVVNGDTVTFNWETTTGTPASLTVRAIGPAAGSFRLVSGDDLSAEDYAIIEEVIIDSIVRGYMQDRRDVIDPA